MKINKLELKNFRCFEDLKVQFPKEYNGLAVFVGVNGAGKTSILDAIARGLKYVQIRLMPQGSSDRIARELPDDDIRVVAHQLGSKVHYEKVHDHFIKLNAQLGENNLGWKITQNGHEEVEGNTQLISSIFYDLHKGKETEVPIIGCPSPKLMKKTI